MDSTITFAVILVIMICVIVFMLELMIPLQVKFDMNGLCRTYYFQVEAQGSLTSEEQTSLTDALEAIGLEDISIVIADSDRRFGSMVTFEVQGQYRRQRMIRLFEREAVDYSMIYERTCYVRKITN